MKNKTLGWGIILTLGACILLVSIDSTSEEFAILIGFALYFFGIWGGIRLINTEDKKQLKD